MCFSLFRGSLIGSCTPSRQLPLLEIKNNFLFHFLIKEFAILLTKHLTLCFKNFSVHHKNDFIFDSAFIKSLNNFFKSSCDFPFKKISQATSQLSQKIFQFCIQFSNKIEQKYFQFASQTVTNIFSNSHTLV